MSYFIPHCYLCIPLNYFQFNYGLNCYLHKDENYNQDDNNQNDIINNIIPLYVNNNIPLSYIRPIIPTISVLQCNNNNKLNQINENKSEREKNNSNKRKIQSIALNNDRRNKRTRSSKLLKTKKSEELKKKEELKKDKKDEIKSNIKENKKNSSDYQFY